jgi:hypothetical protein
MNEMIRRVSNRRPMTRETPTAVEDRPDTKEFLGTALALPSLDQLGALYGEATASIRGRMFDLWEALNEHRTSEGDQIFAFDPENPKLVENFQEMAEKFEWFRLYAVRAGFLVFQQRLISISFTEPAEKQIVVTVAPSNDRVREGGFFSGFRILVIGNKLIYCRPITVGQALSTRTGIRLLRQNLCLSNGKLDSAAVGPLPDVSKVDHAMELIRNTSGLDSFFADVYMHSSDINVDLKLIPVGAYPDVDVQTFKEDVSGLLEANRETLALHRQWTTNNPEVIDRPTLEQFEPLATDAARRGVRNPTGAQLVKWAWQMRVSGGTPARPVFLTPYMISHQTTAKTDDLSLGFGDDFELPDWDRRHRRVSSNDSVLKTLQSLNFEPEDAEQTKERKSSVADFFDMLLSEDED